MKILVIDTETTGVDVTADEICEIGLALYEYESVENKATLLAEYDTLIKPSFPIPAEASAVNHITNAMVKDAPAINDLDVMFSINSLVDQADYFVAHNLPFDWAILERQIPEIFDGIDQSRKIDTCRLAQKVLPDDPSYRLHAMMYRYSLPVPEIGNAHRALFDVKLCLEVLRLCQSYESHDLDQLAEFILKPLIVKVFPFGKYRESEIEEVIQNDSDYMRWLLRQKWLPKEWPDLHYTVIVLMRQRGMMQDKKKEQERRDFFKKYP